MFTSSVGAAECSKSEIDLFTIPPTQTSIENNAYTRVNPQTAVTSSTAPIEFIVKGSSEHFLDLGHIFLYTKFTIKKEDGSLPAPDYKCYPESNILHTLFSEVEVYLNETKISPSASNYSYRAFFENLLSHSADEKKS